MSKEELIINLGPQYLHSQGLLKLIAVCDSEVLKKIEPVIGYSHKGIEKISEELTYMQYRPITAKISPNSSYMYQTAFCHAIEKLCNINVPEKARFIRILMMELNRIYSHLCWIGNYLLDLGNVLPSKACLPLCDSILNIFEKITGQRYSCEYIIFGGVKKDIDIETLDLISQITEEIAENLSILNDLITNNPVFISRTANIGILTPQTALNYSITGVNLRASGIGLDFRKNDDTYKELSFEIPLRKAGDSYDRFVLRTEEISQSIKIVLQCLEKIKNTNSVFNADINQIELIPENKQITTYIESSNGLLACTVFSNGTNKPQRVKWRTPSFYSVQILPVLLKNRYITDIMTILGSLDISMPEADR
ncbi:MAG: NADH-quinone oxidoreductase subunit D [Candidatus Gastranaerophilaceae bacterium]